MSAREIGFDARWCGPHGIGRYATELMRRVPGLTPFRLPLKPSHPLDVALMSARMATLHRGAYIFSPGYNAPAIRLERYLFTVHDLNHLDTPSSSSKRLYYHLFIRRACRTSAGVFTISEFSRRRILDWSGADASRVQNVGCGVSDDFRAAGVRHAEGAPYFLCVGNRKPHKNEVRIVQAFAHARLSQEWRLLINGSPSAELQAAISAAGVQDRVRFFGKVSDLRLAELYRGSRALLFPSLYEGFGLPVAEAMACGVPVMASTATALPETAGDAALLVEPHSVDDIATGIERLAGDNALHADLAARGLRRAPEFSWAKVAARVSATLEDLD